MSSYPIQGRKENFRIVQNPNLINNKIQESANARIWNDAEHTIPHLISKAYISKPKKNYPKTVKFQNSLNIKLQKSPIKKKKEYRYILLTYLPNIQAIGFSIF